MNSLGIWRAALMALRQFQANAIGTWRRVHRSRNRGTLPMPSVPERRAAPDLRQKVA
jgi:hypothetical protein